MTKKLPAGAVPVFDAIGAVAYATNGSKLVLRDEGGAILQEIALQSGANKLDAFKPLQQHGELSVVNAFVTETTFQKASVMRPFETASGANPDYRPQPVDPVVRQLLGKLETMQRKQDNLARRLERVPPEVAPQVIEPEPAPEPAPEPSPEPAPEPETPKE